LSLRYLQPHGQSAIFLFWFKVQGAVITRWGRAGESPVQSRGIVRPPSTMMTWPVE
jgi:hypothetical protein